MIREMTKNHMGLRIWDLSGIHNNETFDILPFLIVLEDRPTKIMKSAENRI